MWNETEVSAKVNITIDEAMSAKHTRMGMGMGMRHTFAVYDICCLLCDVFIFTSVQSCKMGFKFRVDTKVTDSSHTYLMLTERGCEVWGEGWAEHHRIEIDKLHSHKFMHTIHQDLICFTSECTQIQRCTCICACVYIGVAVAKSLRIFALICLCAFRTIRAQSNSIQFQSPFPVWWSRTV